eukprot:15064048-Heterocapsa_arctica.AAC.1
MNNCLRPKPPNPTFWEWKLAAPYCSKAPVLDGKWPMRGAGLYWDPMQLFEDNSLMSLALP